MASHQYDKDYAIIESLGCELNEWEYVNTTQQKIRTLSFTVYRYELTMPR
ncbi:hypothetical protein Xkoz_02266 [Xenorhabdus kozodoii]|uniref:Uncharacterized protein n=1 Tax=Xenorhabdus kozodoii TaxID=351676 RepID=A0A2D0LBC6_9GAMM|nr:hypothetical protein Xkoz_02266 [Xenorhabdus kozodoii]